MAYDRSATSFAAALSYIKDNTVRFHQELHNAACDAVYLACKDGRANWLNELFAVLTPIHQGAFKAWLVSDKTKLMGNEYLKFTAKPKVAGQFFTVKPQTTTVRAAILPLIDPINDDIQLGFWVKEVKQAAKEELGWSDSIGNKLGAALAYAIKANEKQANTVPGAAIEVIKAAMARIKELSTPAPTEEKA